MVDATLAPSRTVAPEPAAVTPSYRRYALSLMLGIYILNFLDRQVINILAEPIKQDLNLADWQIGMMSGLAFALFYTVLGVPIARFAETRNRPFIIAGALTIWSGFTALCGVAQNFVQLCLFRIGVGIGEAGCTPPAHSLITDYVPKSKRASALAFYSMGVPLGSLLGMAMGGVVADAFGWRVAFLVAGLPGVLFALVTFFTLRETRSRLKADVAAASAAQPRFGQAMKLLASKRTFWLLAFAAALKSFISYGQAPFVASFFLRNHAEQVAALAASFNLQSVGFLGLALGIISGICGAISSVLGGWIADKTSAGDVRNSLLAPALAVLVSVPVFILALQMDDARAGLAILIVPYLLNYFWYGPVYGTTQGIVPPNMRATAAAILLFVINLIGLGLGPLAVGLLSDYVAVGMGLGPAEGIRWALIIASCFGVLSAALFWMARKTIAQEMES
ncbi:MAG: MFS transporter [Phenylobacterium sp.]|uniref:spinster family MFS transporter n=1 Tax=Phenylobacterium sp. TaxID=1871053 RepID=UPI00120642A2|nr:MFS transporter [Phenylobacterium sp.]TAJ74485.1 MAG: MFS transporter [Phenylobacterium sp.]